MMTYLLTFSLAEREINWLATSLVSPFIIHRVSEKSVETLCCQNFVKSHRFSQTRCTISEKFHWS